MEKGIFVLIPVIVVVFAFLILVPGPPSSSSSSNLFYTPCHDLTNCSKASTDFALLLFSGSDHVVVQNKTDISPRFDVNYVSVESADGNIVYRLPSLIRTEFLRQGNCKVMGSWEPYIHCENGTVGRFNGFYIKKAPRYVNLTKQLEGFEAAYNATEDTDENMKARYAFHIGRTHEQLGDIDSATKWYVARLNMTGWSQEAFYALYRLGYFELSHYNNTQDAKVTLHKAYAIDPHRREPLYYLARIARNEKDYSACLLYARAALNIGTPFVNSLYVETHVYAWGVLDECAVCLYYTGMKDTARQYWETILSLPTVPAADKERIKSNLRYF